MQTETAEAIRNLDFMYGYLPNITHPTSATRCSAVAGPESGLFDFGARLVVSVQSPVGSTIPEPNVVHTHRVTVSGVKPIPTVLDREVRYLDICEITKEENVCMSMME